MIGDTLRQKYVYATPFADDGFPLVVLDDENKFDSTRTEIVSGQSLYYWEEKEFLSFVESRKKSIDAIIVLDDYQFKSDNKILQAGAKCHLMSFAYHFKKAGFLCALQRVLA